MQQVKYCTNISCRQYLKNADWILDCCVSSCLNHLTRTRTSLVVPTRYVCNNIILLKDKGKQAARRLPCEHSNDFVDITVQAVVVSRNCREGSLCLTAGDDDLFTAEPVGWKISLYCISLKTWWGNLGSPSIPCLARFPVRWRGIPVVEDRCHRWP